MCLISKEHYRLNYCVSLFLKGRCIAGVAMANFLAPKVMDMAVELVPFT